MEMNVLEVGTSWRSLALLCLLRIKYVDHLQEHVTWLCTINP